jgi:hypothetical protein
MGLPFSFQVPEFGPVELPDGNVFPKGPRRRTDDTSVDFLGASSDNVYPPVCVAWAGADQWERGCGKFWWSAKALATPVVGQLPAAGGGSAREADVPLDLVPIESLMWVLEPELLSECVTGRPFATAEDADTGDTPRRPSLLGKSLSSTLSSEGSLFQADDRQKQLAL